MLEQWDTICNAVFDGLLGWLLGLSWHATLLSVAMGTGLILALVRKFATNQDLLRRVDADKARLKQLKREAKLAGDKDALGRYKRTAAMVAMKAFAQEGRPLLLAVLPIAMLATWCYNRLGYFPPREREPVEVVFYGPVSAVGETVTLLPQDGLEADGWVRLAREEKIGAEPTAVARWNVRGTAGKQPYKLVFRWREETFDRGELLVGGRTYAPRIVADDAGRLGAEVRLREARPLNVLPGFGDAFPPWLIGYLVLVIPLAVGIKRVLKVA